MVQYKINKHQFSDSQVDVIELKNESMEVHVTNLGCAIISILTQDKYGNQGDVLLGFDDMKLYETQDKYIGAIVGRCAGRIKGASFKLGEQVYHLPKNNGENTLHGGNVGFDKKVFDYELREDGIQFHYLSKDQEEGFPGNLDVYITYSLIGNKLVVKYDALCDQDSVVNMTNHMYFNLNGKGSVLQHVLLIHADEILCSDPDCCANGLHRKVENTPFDFRESKAIGKDIDEVDEQLAIGSGYDHYFMFNEMQPSVILKDVKSGRVMEVSTNQPGCQIYTANFLDGGLKGKKGRYYKSREAVCIETQAAPNAVHIEKEPSTILRAGEPYCATTTYEFKIEGENTK